MKAKFTVTPRVVDALLFSIVAMEIQLKALQAHRHPHKPAIDRCREAILVLNTLANNANRAIELAQ